MEKIKKRKVNILEKVINVILKILYKCLILFCFFLIIVIVWQRITDSNGAVCGYRLFRIISGSMVPEYNVDEIVVCKDVPINDIKMGDVVVYRGTIDEIKNQLIMHKVIDIKQTDHGLVFHVKGIQNEIVDPNVKGTQIVGKVILKSQLLTGVYSLATSIYSSFIIITILVINVFVSFKTSKRDVKKLNEYNETANENNSKNITVRRYRLKNYEKDIRIIKQSRIKEYENKKNHIMTEIEENEILKEENKRLKEEIEKLRRKEN